MKGSIMRYASLVFVGVLLLAIAVAAHGCGSGDSAVDGGAGGGGAADGGTGADTGGIADSGGAADAGSDDSGTAGDAGEADAGSGGGAGVEALVDGTKVSCTNVLAAGKNATTVNINAATPTGYPVFQITIAAGGGVLTGTAYDCTVASSVYYVDAAGTTFGAAASSGACTVTFSEVGGASGAAVRGAFSATVLDAAKAVTHEITEGTIDVVLK
jgi:hypothetical protein